MRYLLIDKGTNICVNVIEWDGDATKWEPPSNLFTVPMTKDEDAIGHTWNGTALIAPAEDAQKKEAELTAEAEAVVDSLPVRAVIELLRPIATSVASLTGSTAPTKDILREAAITFCKTSLTPTRTSSL